MYMRKKTLFLAMILSALCAVAAFCDDSFRITSVEYDRTGKTREFPLSKAVPIDRERVFPDRQSLDAYVQDLLVQFSNQRVLESTTIDTVITDVRGADGVVGVSLVVHTVDSWNVIALPKPSFDSNSGFELKIKLKDYNFFGSMQELNSDIAYSIDNDGKNSFSANLDFDIPFQFANHELEWSNDMSMNLPIGQTPEFSVGTGLSVMFPLSFSKLIFAVDQKAVINDRDSDDVLYADDPFYLNEKLSLRLPIVLMDLDRYGNLVWSPDASVGINVAPGGIDAHDLKGTELSFGHSLSMGRVDWVGNFREGFSASIWNTYGYNTFKSSAMYVSVSGKATGFLAIGNRFGINSRLNAMQVISGSKATAIAEPLRGILNKRVDSDSAVSLNLDFPITVMDIDFVEITGVKWTKFIGFEMQASPFVDMMLTHDAATGRYYALRDGWYSGGLEVLVFLKKMRSITVRASAGYDLQDYVVNGWSMRDRAGRDGYSTHEYVIGLGLHY